MRFFLNIVLLLCFISAAAQKENKIEILNANTMEYNKNLGNGAQRLLGDVQFKHNNMLMYCDSAYYYAGADSLHAFSNIHMIQGDTLHLWGNFLRYDGNTGLAQVRRNVKMVDRDATLTTEFLDYDLNTKIGYYYNGGNIVNKENHLKSEKGYYHSKTKDFYFRHKVCVTNKRDTILSDTLKYNTVTRISYFFGPTQIYNNNSYIYCENGWYNTATDISEFKKNAYLKNKTQILKGDSIYYDGKNKMGRAWRNVELIDTSRNMTLKGRYGYYLEKDEFGFMTDSALMINYDEKDTLYLHADTLITRLDSTKKNKNMKAYHKVKFFRNDMQGKCDSLEYTQADSTMRMFVMPILWANENQLTGEYIEVFFANGQMHKAKLYTTPFIVSKEDNTKYNQVRGKLMTGYFRDNRLYKIVVNGNGQTIYYPKDKDELIGVNKAECTDMIIHVVDNKVKSIDFMNNPDALLTPVDQISSNDLILKGFVWFEQYRPLKMTDIFKKD